MKLAVVFLAVFAVCSADSDDEAWDKQKKVLLGKSLFSVAKEALYKSNFLLAKKAVEENNAKYDQNEVDFELGLNEYSHLTDEEFYRFRTGRKSDLGANAKSTKYVSKSGLKGRLPDRIDWHETGHTTSVKNQGTCGSCFSFSTTAAVEGQVLLKNGSCIDLANQQILDCSGPYGNGGCNGGMEVNVWEYLQDTEGLMAYADYPYVNRAGRCQYQSRAVHANVVSYKRHLGVTDEQLKEIVAKNGPVCVAVHVVNGAMSNYKSGVYTDTECKSTMAYLNHAVLLVGYGVLNGQQYWKIKNSWGDKWGKDGYLYINMKTNCGVTTDVSYPSVELVR